MSDNVEINRDTRGRYEKKKKSQELVEIEQHSEEFPLSKRNVIFIVAWLIIIYVIWKNKYLDRFAEKADKFIIGFGNSVYETTICHKDCLIEFAKSSKDVFVKVVFREEEQTRSDNQNAPNLNVLNSNGDSAENNPNYMEPPKNTRISPNTSADNKINNSTNIIRRTNNESADSKKKTEMSNIELLDNIRVNLELEGEMSGEMSGETIKKRYK